MRQNKATQIILITWSWSFRKPEIGTIISNKIWQFYQTRIWYIPLSHYCQMVSYQYKIWFFYLLWAFLFNWYGSRNLIFLPTFDDIIEIFLFCSSEMYLCTRCSNAAKYCGSECDVMTLIDRDQHGQDLASHNYKKIAKYEEELYRVLCSEFFLLYLRDALCRCTLQMCT